MSFLLGLGLGIILGILGLSLLVGILMIRGGHPWGG